MDTPSDYIQSLVNIRKDTLKLIKWAIIFYLDKQIFKTKVYRLNDSVCESAPALNLAQRSNFVNQNSQKYSIEFVFDCDCDVEVNIHFFANEKYLDSNNTNKKLSYVCSCLKYAKSCICINFSRNDQKPFLYKKGANITFKQPEFFFIPSDFPKNSVSNFLLFQNKNKN